MDFLFSTGLNGLSRELLLIIYLIELNETLETGYGIVADIFI